MRLVFAALRVVWTFLSENVFVYETLQLGHVTWTWHCFCEERCDLHRFCFPLFLHDAVRWFFITLLALPLLRIRAF